ncbi:hypothetical protein PsorP6_015438 [Peronosclerospora sorghi]|uniref:Uncharacterized protein n=1 Tax=Peronosclerospora sorghi TaxID=230839 RepID=A0ACC0WP99_9STRA|nr:hypothetical protein PsorP6_015438 [Peronosclerospora sorghi]
MTLRGRVIHGFRRTPFMTMRMEPLDDVTVAIACCSVHGVARTGFPRFEPPVLMEPLDHVQVPIRGRLVHGRRGPDGKFATKFAAVQPLDDVYMAMGRGGRRCPRGH